MTRQNYSAYTVLFGFQSPHLDVTNTIIPSINSPDRSCVSFLKVDNRPLGASAYRIWILIRILGAWDGLRYFIVALPESSI